MARIYEQICLQLEQLLEWNPNPLRQPVHVVDTDVAAADFHLSDVGPGDAALLRQVFKGHPGLFAFFPQAFAEGETGGGGIVLGFGHRVGWRVPA